MVLPLQSLNSSCKRVVVLLAVLQVRLLQRQQQGSLQCLKQPQVVQQTAAANAQPRALARQLPLEARAADVQLQQQQQACSGHS
jgi:hypothetical protein